MPEHKHEWKDAPDWDWGPTVKAQECFPCRGLRLVRLAPKRKRR
jgi:hypothetical protein